MSDFDLGLDEYAEDDRLHSNYTPLSRAAKMSARIKAQQCTPEERRSKDRNDYYMRKYNITWKHYQELLTIQEKGCAICKARVELVVDHCHKTSTVRGLLCNTCNMGIGLLQEDLRIIHNAFYYLKSQLVKN